MENLHCPTRMIRLLLDLNFSLLEHQRFAHDSLPHILDVLNYSLKVRGSVVRARDKDVIVFARRRRSVQRCD
jgi:hypothetical protein